MFMVFSKDKILAYLVSIGTVAILFVMSFAITNNNLKKRVIIREYTKKRETR